MRAARTLTAALLLHALRLRRTGTRRDGRGGLPTALLPESVLVALRREGLDPVVGPGGRYGTTDPVTRLARWFGVTAWLVSGPAEVRSVLGRASVFSSDFSRLSASAGIDLGRHPGGLGFSDPPDHTRLRRLLTPEFTVRRLRGLDSRIREIVDDRLAAVAREPGPVDLVRSFALPVPALTICELLGVPLTHHQRVQELSVAHFDVSGGPEGVFGALSTSMSLWQELVRGQRESPGAGLLGTLVREHGDELADGELAGLADGVVTGGLESTASMLALGALVLLQEPERLREIREREEPGEAVDALVEELLRYLSVVQVAFPRFVRRDTEVAGVRMRKGDLVLCSLSGANRDSGLGAGMGEFDPDRRTGSHLAFGHGIHRCIGAELARMELRAALPALARRFPRMRLAIEPEEVPFRELSVVYGVDSLPVLLS